MAGSEQRDPRARRWTILLALLAAIVLAGVSLRVLDERRSSGERVSGKRDTEHVESRARENRGETVEETTAATTPTPTTSAPPEQSLRIEVGQVPDVDGHMQDVVYSLGPASLGSGSTLPAISRSLGDPDSSGPAADDENICDATWITHGLEARFYFGHPPSPAASCQRGPIAAALMTGERWFVDGASEGGDGTLTLRDPERMIDTAFPGAVEETLPPGLATFADSPRGFVIATSSYGGDHFPTLYAIVVDGEVVSFLYVSGAD